jgi:hypothetical protein
METPLPAPKNTWASVASSASASASASSCTQFSSRPVAFRGSRSQRHNLVFHHNNRANRSRAAATHDDDQQPRASHKEHNGNGNSNDSGNANNTYINGLLEEGKAGVVVIEGPVRSINRFLSFAASRIHEGAVYDLSEVNERKAIVIFQFALHAQIFVDRNTESVAIRGESILGSGDWTVTLGQPLEWTDTLRRMAHPCRERRRLTFVKPKLFADQGSYLKWVREVEDVAGAGNVDFVWAFNTGNGIYAPSSPAENTIQSILTNPQLPPSSSASPSRAK